MIARNRCLNYKRDNTITYDQLEDLHLLVNENVIESKEIVDLVTMSLDLLPEHYREAFVLREYNGLSYSEVGEATGQSVEVVKVRIHRAKEKVRKVLAPLLLRNRTIRLNTMNNYFDTMSEQLTAYLVGITH